MTPAPISVERLRELHAVALQWPPRNLDIFTDAMHEALPALLHQLAELERKASNRHAQVIESDAMCADLRDKLAERDAEVDRLKAQAEEDRELRMDVERQWNQMMGQLEAAERAKEGATGLLRRVNASLYLLDKPHREFGGVTDKTATDIAAFLAASGGA